MSNNHKYDLAIIGSGPGGYIAAIRAAQLKLKTAIIEQDSLGGVCLNWGCIPSKSLIHQAQVFSSINELNSIGVAVDAKNLDYSKVYQKSRNAARRLSKGVEFLLKKNGITVIKGRAVLYDSHIIKVDNREEVTAENIIIATGSRPRGIPALTIDEKDVLSSTGALKLQELPKSILIIGAGSIGVEFSYIFSSFGAEVTLVEILGHILPNEDEEISDTATKAFKRKDITIYTNTAAESLEKEGGKITVTLKTKEGPITKTFEKILVAAGRAPNSEGLGLEKLNIKTEKGYIKTGDFYETDAPGVYAIGDITGPDLLAHAASREGEIAVEHLTGLKTHARINRDEIPRCVYSQPETASFGPAEKDLKAKGINYAKAVFPYRGNGKSVAVEMPEGLVKLLYNKDTTKILGAHIVGANATELIHEILLAKARGILPAEVADIIHAHPTLSEAIKEAALLAEGRAIHI